MQLTLPQTERGHRQTPGPAFRLRVAEGFWGMCMAERRHAWGVRIATPVTDVTGSQ